LTYWAVFHFFGTVWRVYGIWESWVIFHSLFRFCII
jgi:hypothetical protein